MAGFSRVSLTVLLLWCSQDVLAARVNTQNLLQNGQEGIKNRRAAIMQQRQEDAGIDENTQYQNDQQNNIAHIIQEQPSQADLLEEMPFPQVSSTYTDDKGKSHPRKDIYLLGGAMPPVWPHRLGTLRFLTNRGMTIHPEDADGLLETNDAGTPLANGSPCGQSRQARCPIVTLEKNAAPVDIPFNTQLEDLEFRKTAGDHFWSGGACSSCAPRNRDRYVTTACCTYVDNFDAALFERTYKKGVGIELGSGSGLKEVDFAVHWEVSTMKFGESIPVVAPQAFIGFGVDGSDSDQGKKVILDLGMAFYSCDGKSTQPSPENLQDCTYRGMLNFETEANHPKSFYAKAWDESPGTKPSQKRTKRCTDPTHMCAGQPHEFSGLVFKEKVDGESVAEYSGELIGGGGDGDDSWMYLNLDGLKTLGVTHALLTGHEFNGVPLKQLTGAFYRLAAGKVIDKKGHMQTILYQDLDEAKEPPTPRHPHGSKAESNAMLLGVFTLRDDTAWSFGPMPEAAKGSHWQFTVLNTPIKGKTLSSTKTEIKNVLNRQISPVPVEEQDSLNAQIGTTLDLGLNTNLAEMAGDVNIAYQRLPGGAPGAATRNFHFLPEASRSIVSLVRVSGAEVCAGKKIAIDFNNVAPATVNGDGTAAFDPPPTIEASEQFGKFTKAIQVTCDGEVVDTVPTDQRRTLPPLVFTAHWSNFQSDYALNTDTGMTLEFTVKVLSAEW